MTWSNHDGVITHLQPDILECEVKQTLGSVTTNKMSGGDGIPAEFFNILKDDAAKMLHSVFQQIWKTQQWSLYSNPKEEQCQRMFKIPHNGTHFTCQQGNAQNPSSQVSTICKPRTSGCSNQIQKRQRNQRSNRQYPEVLGLHIVETQLEGF